MKVELLYFDGCPNWHDAHRNLRAAAERTGTDVEVTFTEITTPEHAERRRFRGSPTILINGVDPFADEGGEVGLSCRIYTGTGEMRGSPSTDELVTALNAAR
jgi:hypothetical protein